ncbi:MAG: DUF551 domain-containing protein [Lachnospiraceae bacterium]|nr:DUF551 domain-containing protein [Lachnospiraceae bacterium]
MGTLTFHNEDGTWGLKNYDITKVPSELYGAICKLKEYEATGITPEQILEIDKLYQQRLKEIKNLKQQLAAGSGWIPCSERYPENDKYILISFENFSVPTVGRYEEDEHGGAFYVGDDLETCIEQDLIVNAWQPLPEPYRPEEPEKGEGGDEQGTSNTI